MDKWKCDLVRGFIEENKDITFLYIMKTDSDECEDMIQFIEEMRLESKFMIYCHIKSEMS